MTELRCMSYTSKGTSELLVAGLQDIMFTIDVEKGTVTKQVRSIEGSTPFTKFPDSCS
jgi:PAB-dependent poly(A)-specific ribonuclease subunit 2